jgi:hypothetical protein
VRLRFPSASCPFDPHRVCAQSPGFDFDQNHREESVIIQHGILQKRSRA